MELSVSPIPFAILRQIAAGIFRSYPECTHYYYMTVVIVHKDPISTASSMDWNIPQSTGCTCLE